MIERWPFDSFGDEFYSDDYDLKVYDENKNDISKKFNNYYYDEPYLMGIDLSSKYYVELTLYPSPTTEVFAMDITSFEQTYYSTEVGLELDENAYKGVSNNISENMFECHFDCGNDKNDITIAFKVQYIDEPLGKNELISIKNAYRWLDIKIFDNNGNDVTRLFYCDKDGWRYVGSKINGKVFVLVSFTDSVVKEQLFKDNKGALLKDSANTPIELNYSNLVVYVEARVALNTM